MDNPQKTETPPAVEEKTREVLVRFRPSELAEMKDETGAMADATAVACFVRKNLKKKD
jgi:hypothetical protein